MHTVSFHFTEDWEWCRSLCVVLYSGQHNVMILAYDGNKPSWAAILGHDSLAVSKALVKSINAGYRFLTLFLGAA